MAPTELGNLDGSGDSMTAIRRRWTPDAGASPPSAAPIALAVADANWFSTENLFSELERPGVSTLLLKCVDYVNAFRDGRPPWSWPGDLTRRRPGLWERRHVLPSGWMKRFPSLGMRPIGRTVLDWRQRHAPEGRLALVTTYPHYLYLRDQVKPDLHVYLNVDDYAQYWPRQAARIDELERQSVREADITVCVSDLRCKQLQTRVPEAAHKIHHMPHGTPSTSLTRPPSLRPDTGPEDLAGLSRPLLGFVGSLEDRIDWPLLIRLADEIPQATIVLIGRLKRSGVSGWADDARHLLSRPNVVHLGWRPQSLIDRYNRSFDVCLIPYRTDHPFNRACSPTKISDYMGTGRPIVSTDIPECRLYSHLFDVADDADGFIASVAALLGPAGEAESRALDRRAWAVDHACRRLADRLLDWLPA